ncbi:MAG: phage tail fiber protein [Pseudomonadota bacterium]
MAIPNQTPYNIFTANGISSVFPYEFYLLNAFDLTVSINGAELTSGFTISGIGTVAGGEVAFLTPPANGSVVLLERVVPTYRLTEYQDNGDLLAETVNKDFDRLWMAIQQAFIYLGLALTRPLLGGPFNAYGYRIENLGNPVNAQDAATKNYVDSVGDNWFKRTLRVPESSMSQLPTAAERADSLLGWNDQGQPIPVFAMTETADLAIKLAGYYGAYRIGYGLSTVGDVLDGFLSVRRFMTKEQWADANSSNPVMDHSSAFIEALSKSAFIYAPPVAACYNVGDVEAPFGMRLLGSAYKPYTVVEDSDFYGCGSVIRKMRGATSIFKFRSRTTLEGIVFDGVDKTIAFVQTADSYMPRNFRAIRCGFYRHQHAIGGPAGKYIGAQITDCQIANNFRGVYNTIDSMFTSVTINANDDDGVNLQKGANDNSFINCRIEWNGGNNVVASGSRNNTIIGELNDRAGKAGIAVISAEMFVTGVRMRRNGRFASGTSNSTHFRMEGPGAKLIISAVETKIGADDVGGGATTPEYSIYTSGASTDMTLIINGSNFGGSTGTHVYMAVRPDTVRISGNVGINDYSNVGANRTVNGFNFVDALTKQHSMPRQVVTLPLSQPKYGETSRYMSREIEIISRDVNTGNSEFYWMTIQFATESFGVRHYIIEEKSVPANRYGTSGAVVTVAIANLSSDASTFDVVLTPTDSIEREVNIYLK